MNQVPGSEMAAFGGVLVWCRELALWSLLIRAPIILWGPYHHLTLITTQRSHLLTPSHWG